MKTYKMYLVLGDWSNDGHGKSDKILLDCNVPVNEVQQAYKDSCKLTGISFDGDSKNFTDIANPITIADQYENPYIPAEAVKIFTEKFGWDQFGNDKIKDIEQDGSIWLDEELFVKLWIWFIRLSHPEITLAVVDNKIPCINGYWSEVLNVNFGYGLYI